ncbi:MAG: four helix bundle protein [Verrucomicrobiae bacterium]|nr:four helix bundle protein [Verrucomicrobiae bacterium]
MRYQRFEELPVWSDAQLLAQKMYEWTAGEEFRGRHSLKDQLERAALSVSNNIAEGFERGTNREILAFLYIARGSAGEVRSMLALCDRMPQFERTKVTVLGLRKLAESCSKQLKGWADNLQNSSYQGQRYVNREEREREVQEKRGDAFMEKLRNSLPANHPLRREG